MSLCSLTVSKKLVAILKHCAPLQHCLKAIVLQQSVRRETALQAGIERTMAEELALLPPCYTESTPAA